MRTPLTREHIRRSQAPQGPIDDPPTPLQGGQEGCLVLRHQAGYLNGGHDRGGGRASLYLSLVSPASATRVQYLGGVLLQLWVGVSLEEVKG